MLCKLLLTLALVSFGESRNLPDGDRVLIGELRQLGDSLLDVTLQSELRNRLSVAESIIQSNVADQSMIERMQAFADRWSSQTRELNEHKFKQFSAEFAIAFGSQLQVQYNQEDDVLNQYTKGAYAGIKAKVMEEYTRGLTSFRDMANLKMAEVSQGTKDADRNLVRAYHDFVDSKKLTMRDFFTFLKTLRNY
ncbi:hypothetical protein KR222_005816 [Zaprionus bogoriensis]|nr:hypothetical protein KR222_005816 [Zaprionus bogoriensis]